MTAPRIPLLSVEAATRAAVQFGIDERKAGASIYRVLLRHPQFAKQVNDVVEMLMNESTLEPRLRELIIMRIGWLKKGIYEWSQHWWIASRLGVEERDLLAVREWQAHDHWSSLERAIFRATDETVARGTVSQATWDDCATHFITERERIDLIATIGVWNMMSEVLTSLTVPLEEGVVPWPPDGVSPA